MPRNRRMLLRMLLGVAAVLAAGRAESAPDDRVESPREKAAAAAQVNVDIAPENFDQWMFGGAQNASAARERLHAQVKLQLDELTRDCGLSEAQKQKLLLAARGDEKRFFDDVEVVRQKFLAVRRDQNAVNAIWQDIQPLQTRQAAGLFGERSFFGKTLQKTLTPEQVAKHRLLADERRRFRYRAAIDASLLTLENTVPLRHEQREKLVQMLVERTEPPRTFGQHDQYVVIYRMSKLPHDELRALLDERQWKLLQAQLGRARGFEQFLVQNGVLLREDVAVKPTAPVRLKSVVTGRGRVERPADAARPNNRPTSGAR